MVLKRKREYRRLPTLKEDIPGGLAHAHTDSQYCSDTAPTPLRHRSDTAPTPDLFLNLKGRKHSSVGAELMFH